MKVIIIFFLFFLSQQINVYCQPDSSILREELLRINFVPFKFSKDVGDKGKKFTDIQYLSIHDMGPRIIPILWKLLLDSTKTKIKNKCSGTYFTVGQLSFILIDDIESIPFSEVTGRQFDVIESCSVLPDGLLIYIRFNGAEFQAKYKIYFYSTNRIEWLRKLGMIQTDRIQISAEGILLNAAGLT
jgi:hypothetical protein